MPWRSLAQALPHGEHQQMNYGGHAMSVTDSENFNAILLTWLQVHSRQSQPPFSSLNPTEIPWPKH